MLSSSEFAQLVRNQGPLIIDGALATELENRGHDLNHALWSAKILREQPESIRKVHEDYFLAGADIAITASYQASVIGFHEQAGLSETEAIELIKHSVVIAQEARDLAYKSGVPTTRTLLVAGSVGPYGAYLADGSEYRGDYIRTREDFESFHESRIRALIEAGVDLLAIETMPVLSEIEALLHLLSTKFPTATAWISCTIKDSERLCDGTPLERFVEAVVPWKQQIVAIGVNCISCDLVPKSIERLRLALKEHDCLGEIQLLCYPNSGDVWDAATKTWHTSPHSDLDLLSMLPQSLASGCMLVGGCCRTTPSDIKAIRAKLRIREAT